MRYLVRRVDFLERDRARLEALLADALDVATAGEGVPVLRFIPGQAEPVECAIFDPPKLMHLLADLRGFNLARGAVIDVRKRAVA